MNYFKNEGKAKAKCETSLITMSTEIRLTKQKIENYDERIKTHSDMCDDIRSGQNYNDSAINTLFRRGDI